jgi:hypothetical protein
MPWLYDSSATARRLREAGRGGGVEHLAGPHVAHLEPDEVVHRRKDETRLAVDGERPDRPAERADLADELVGRGVDDADGVRQLRRLRALLLALEEREAPVEADDRVVRRGDVADAAGDVAGRGVDDRPLALRARLAGPACRSSCRRA